MRLVNMHEAKTQLSKLVEAALRGEEVIICRAGEPVVQFTPVAAAARRPRTPGRLKGIIGPSPTGAFAPVTREEAAEWFGAPVEPRAGR